MSTGPPPPPASPTQGRFVAVPTPMSIRASVDYCRANYAALASIHSIEEQRQAALACSSFANADGTTVSDQAANGGYGCWIGFEDSATEGGFSWQVYKQPIACIVAVIPRPVLTDCL